METITQKLYTTDTHIFTNDFNNPSSFLAPEKNIIPQEPSERSDKVQIVNSDKNQNIDGHGNLINSNFEDFEFENSSDDENDKAKKSKQY